MKFRRLTLGLVLLLGAGAFAQAQDPAGAHLDRAYKYGLGTYLVDAEGRTVYVRSGDTSDSSGCYDDCAVNWPPVPGGAGLTAGAGVDATLLSQLERDDATSQATYAGMPLYYFAADEGLGSVAGQGLNSTWYALAPDGSPLGANRNQFRAGPATQGLDRAYKYSIGTYLIDAAGFSLYAFTDDDGESTCLDSCASNWPSLLGSDDVAVGGGLDESLIASTSRPGGASQLTYAGHPLYRFRGDDGPGSVQGQGLAGKWYLLAPDGSLIGMQTEASDPGVDDEVDQQAAAEPETQEVAAPPAEEPGQAASIPAEVLQLGATVFASGTTPACASCHGAEGEGGAGPKLADNPALDNSERLIRTVLRGGHIMPAFGDQLNDERVAAVLTFVRNSWGNDFGAITADEVATSR